MRHPPTDFLAAAYFGYKQPENSEDGRRLTPREAMRANSATLKGESKAMPAMPKQRPLESMPAYLRTPEKMAMIERLRKEASQGEPHA